MPIVWILTEKISVVGSPKYFERHPRPETPHDLPKHTCVNIRHRLNGSIYAWEFEDAGQGFTLKGEGPLVFKSVLHVLNAALDGVGLA